MVGPQRKNNMVDFNLEYSFDLPVENLSSAIVEKNFEDLIEGNVGEGNLTTDDVANSTTDDVGNLAVLCGLTITNQSLKIVQVNSAFLSSYKKYLVLCSCSLLQSHLLSVDTYNYTEMIMANVARMQSIC